MNGIGQSLERIREQLRLSPEFVERETGLRVGQLRSIELEAAPVETCVVGELCDLYGVDPGEVASGRADAVLDAVRLLPMGDPAAVSEKVRTEISSWTITPSIGSTGARHGERSIMRRVSA